MFHRVFLAGAIVMATGSTARADQPTPTFDDDIAPLLTTYCQRCHGADLRKNNLDSRTLDGLLKGGKTGPAVAPGSLKDSLLWANIANDKMPAQGEKLNEAQRQMIRAWILAGAPKDRAAVKASTLKKTSPLAKRGVAEMAKAIDAEIASKLTAAAIPASPRADDAEFLRRVYLDLTGRIPSVEATIAFLDDPSPKKRSALIDRLLESPEYGQHFAMIWHKLLIPKTAEAYRQVEHAQFKKWLADRFNQNRPWSETATTLLTASGALPPDKPGPGRDKEIPGFPRRIEVAYMAIHHEDGRPQPRAIAASSVRLFLGVQIECAQCHNHPLARWKQSEFWGIAAFFERVRPQGFSPTTVHEPNNGKEAIYNQKGRYYRIPAVRPEALIDMEDDGNRPTGKLIRARFLGGEEVEGPVTGSLREMFAKWATAPENPYFSRAYANRMWGHLFGRGIVDPIDDMQEDNPASHPELLDALAAEFAAAGFDQKHLIRCICDSDAYQRTSSPLEANRADKTLRSHQALKLMTAEMVLESLTVASPVFAEKRAEKPKDSGANRGGFNEEEFLSLFVTDESDPTSYSRGLVQALRLMNKDGRLFGVDSLKNIVDRAKDPASNIERIYLAVLSRRPTEAESKLMVEFCKAPESIVPPDALKPASKTAKTLAAPDVYADIYWALLNSAEFVFSH